ncbi:hypothetical protein SADUNF_Sadunf13G0107100 [Salix dunnii]|uniref:Uncharacterized protein n=1 Tax=Salix dunnii TaxID=1413687 RepID=A0A835MLB1_9ROSI|nr:hypothetical protein SADUNF_Sadunf13G0107100 [Salix dunnii]
MSKRKKVGQPIWQSFLKFLSIEIALSHPYIHRDSRDPLKLRCWNDFTSPAGKASNSSEKPLISNSLSWVRLPSPSSGKSLKLGHILIANRSRERNCRKPSQSILMSL